MKQQSSAARKYAGIAAIIGWITLILQLYLIIANRIVGVPETVLRYFSYFTILSNIMAALSYTAVWLNPVSGRLKPLTKSSSLTAVTVYIVMVGIIYNTVLRGLADLQGLQLIVDRFLHSILPASFLLFWFLYVSKEGLKWKNALLWLWYPVAYIIYIMILGALTGFYPYPFANVDVLGYPKALMNGLYITIAFGVLSTIFVAIAKKSASTKRTVMQ